MEKNEFETKKLVEQLVEKLLESHNEFNARFRDFNFSIKSTKNNKYYKIVIQENELDYMSHAFIERVTGDVFSPSNKRKPRYNLYKDIDYLKRIADWAGGYLLH